MAASKRRLQRELERFKPNDNIDIYVDDTEDTLIHANMKVRFPNGV